MRNFRQTLNLAAAAVLAVAVFAGPAQAGIMCDLGVMTSDTLAFINPATGLPWQVGDVYRLVFHTSEGHAATSTDIAVYNEWVQSLANASTAYAIGAADGVTWKAIGSTATVDARDNTSTNPTIDPVGGAIYLLDGSTVVANDNTDLWDGSVDHIIDRTEIGTTWAHWPWTGTARDGTAAPGPGANGNPLGVNQVNQGQASVATNWITRVWTMDPYTNVLPMYAMADPEAVVAADYVYWDLNGDTAGAGGPAPTGIWDAGTKWNPAPDGTVATEAWSAGARASFSAGVDATDAYTVTVVDTQDIAGLAFTSGTVTLTGGTALRMVSTAWVEVGPGLTATIETPITEDVAGRKLIVRGAGTLVLSGTGAYTGGTFVQDGTLRLGANDVLPDAPPVTVCGYAPDVTATLDLDGHDETVGGLVLGGWSTTSGAAVTTGTGTLTLGGDVTYNDDVTYDAHGYVFNPLGATIGGKLDLGAADRTFAINDSTTAEIDLDVSAAISGAVGLAKTGAGTLLLSGNNTYTGVTTMSAGKLILSGDNAAATGGMALNGGVTQFDTLASINGTDRNVAVNAGAAVLFGSSFADANIPAALSRITAGSAGVIAADNQAATAFDFGAAGLDAARLGAIGDVAYTGTLTPAGGTYRLGGGGGTLTLPNANSLTGGNSLVVSGNVTLAADNDYSGPTTVNAGTLNVYGSLASQGLNVNDGTLNVYAALATSTIAVNGGALNLNAAWTGSTLTVTGGTTTLGAAGTSVATADFSAPGSAVVNATIPLAVTNQMQLPGGTTVTTSGPAMLVAGSNIASNASGRTITVSGGTVTMVGVAQAGAVVPLANIAATAGNNQFSDITDTTAWIGMSAGTQAAPDKNALAGNDYTKQWTPGGSNHWGKWQLDKTADTSFNLNEVFWWQYSQAGQATRGISTAQLFYSNSITDPGIPGASNPNWTKFYDNTAGTGLPAFPLSGGVANHHVVVQLSGLSFDARWIGIMPTNTLLQDGIGLGSILFHQPGAVSVALPTTNIAATASTTLDLSNAAANHILGSLTLSGTGTAVGISNAAGVSFAGINGAADTTLDMGEAALTLNVAADQTAEFAGTLAEGSAAVSLTKTGAGTQILSGANTYTGATILSGGTLSVWADNNLGNSNPLIFDGGTLRITGTALTSYAAGAIGSHAVTQNANKTIGLDIADAGNTFTVSEVLAQGTGGFTKTGAGTVVSTQANTYTGATTVSEGTLTLSGNRTVTSGQVIVGNVEGSTGTLNIQGDLPMGGNILNLGINGTGIANQTNGTVSFTGGTQILAGNGTGTGEYNLSGGTLSIAGVANRGIILGVNTGSTATFNLSGTGTLTMAGTSCLQIARSENTAATGVTGIFNQTGGTATVRELRMGGSVAVNNANATATLNLSGGTFSAASFTVLSGGNTSSSTINISGTADVTLPAFPTARGTDSTATVYFDGGTLRPAAASATYMGNLTAAYIMAGGATFDVPSGKDITITQDLLTDGFSTGGLTKSGAGTLTLSGVNTYAGDTIVEAGTLSIINAELANAADVYIAADAFFNLNFTGTDTISQLFLDGDGQLAGTWGSLDSTATNKSGFFTGDGLLLVTTSGILPGDTDNNGVVDAADFITLKKNFGAGEGGDQTVGNFDKAGTVDWADLSTLMTNMGVPGDAPATTPEPATLGLLAIGALAVIRRRGRS